MYRWNNRKFSKAISKLKVACGRRIIIEDFYKNRPVRIYTDYAPCLRSERAGLKVINVNL